MTRQLAIASALAILLAACGGGSASPSSRPTDDDGSAAQTVAPLDNPLVTAAIIAEADDDPSLPGDYIDLPAIYGGPYPATAQHATQDLDYEAEGIGEPPVGGRHWSGACTEDPITSAPFCGPAPWGVYREPWNAETLVHNMEHAGVVVWYNTDDADVIGALEDFALDQFVAGVRLVVTPYPDMADGTIAITTWSRRDAFPAAELDAERLQRFMDANYCRFDPEGLCR